MRVDLPKPKYLERQRTTFFEQVIDRVRSQPGVEKAGMVNVLPGHGYGSDDSFTIPEHPPLPPGHVLLAIKRYADPGYFAAMQIPLLRGRTFNERQRLDQATSVVISDLFGRTFLPGEDPVGKHLRVNLTDHEIDYEIVGVVGDTRFQISRPAEPIMYFPLRGMHPVQVPWRRCERIERRHADSPCGFERIVSEKLARKNVSVLGSIAAIVGEHSFCKDELPSQNKRIGSK